MKDTASLFPSVFRAIEVAKTGGYSVSIYIDKMYTNGFEDYEFIKASCKGWFENFVPNGDIKVELSRTLSHEGSNYNTIESLKDRIKNSLAYPKPNLDLNKDCEALLNNAIGKLEFSIPRIILSKEIAATIARMDFSEKIKAEHICEAIQYSYIWKSEGYFNAENRSKIFGKAIEVKLVTISTKEVKAAIEYLTTLL